MTNLIARDFSDELLAWYERQPWLRAVVQAVPGFGGSADTILAWRGTVLGQRRFMELVAEVSARVSELETRVSFASLQDDESFIELFKIVAETAAASASAEKRKRAAALLAGTLSSGTVSDLSNQIARDLAVLDDFHLVILTRLPSIAHRAIDPLRGPLDLNGITDLVYRKAISDFERLGFVRYDTTDIGTLNGGPGRWVTTEYLLVFVRAIADRDPAAST